MICNKTDCLQYDETFKSNCFLETMRGVDNCPYHKPRLLRDCKHKPFQVTSSSSWFWVECKCGHKISQHKDFESAEREL